MCERSNTFDFHFLQLLQEIRRKSRNAPPEEYAENIASEALSLFALLINLRHSMFIHEFSVKGLGKDALLESWIGKFPNEIIPEFWHEFESKDPDIAHIVGVDFREKLPRYCPPILDSPAYVEWGPDRILPFMNEELIGETGNSKVYCFEIHDEYRNFKHYPNVRKFARKEISNRFSISLVEAVKKSEKDDMARQEKQVLQRIGYAQDPHIVRMIKTYKHGDSFNIVFPWAKTNLDDYIRKSEPHQAHKCRIESVAECSFWIQLRGITQALSKVHNIDQLGSAGQRDVRDNERDFGVHSDLKPSNILVEEDGRWVISDFGQATFRTLHSRDETSSIRNRGGTATYAPPEFEHGTHKRAFDIFSLGIIFLEVAAFVIRSYEGLVSEDQDHPGLDNARKTVDNDPHIGDNYRFYVKDQSDRCHLKEGITTFMQDLQRRVSKDSNDHLFVTDLLELIRQMLSCNPNARPRAREVDLKLSKLIEDHSNEGRSIQATNLQRTHVERYNQRLQEVGRMGSYIKHDGVRHRIVVVIDPADEDLILFRAFSLENDPTESYRLPKKAILVPQYAFATNETSAQRFDITFPRHEDNAGIYDHEFYNEEAAEEFQSILTGQIVRASFPITGFNFKERHSSLRKMFPFGRSKKASRKMDQNNETSASDSVRPVCPNLVQLWEGEEEASWLSKDAPPKLSVGDELPPRRVVIFGVEDGRSIAILRIHANFRLIKQSGLIGKFCPTNDERDDRFSMTILRPLHKGDPGSLAGIPIDPQNLLRCEREGKQVQCKEASLEFESEHIQQKFVQEYLKLKKEWADLGGANFD
ncbi:protein kinase domain-containing protein [Diplodia corticola]|uniref:Protein kinase domain-containing protein n=1 Tax=Diplodia corticola TaxID=236234 RepID=A0A1J9SKC4_9PEZI|nr:protein kinase domain-containing protein [Diplodia corticola]OJD40791.1 protein kinase domain-containing protein [Diplodia corticola]